MPVVRKKTHLGRVAFQARTAAKSTPGWGPTYSDTVNVIRVRPEEVVYNPYKVPGWRQKIRNHQDATSDIIGNKFSVSTSQASFGYYIRYSGGAEVEYKGSGELFVNPNVIDIPFTAPDTDPMAQALAAENFVKRYYEKTRSLRGASSLAEATSTIRGLASPAKALRGEIDNLYNSLRKRLYRSSGTQVKDGAKVIAGTWLEWKFGIEPLISDADGYAKAVNKMSEGNFNCSVPIKGAGRSVTQGVKFENQGWTPEPGFPAPGMADWWIEDVTRCVIRGAINVYPPGRECPPVMQFGVGVEDIAPAVWEAIPWSFFIDYFVNVSSVIDAWSMLTSRLAWTNRLIRNERTLHVTDLRPYPPSGTLPNTIVRYSAVGGQAEAKCTSILRSRADWRDLAPSLRVKLPTGGIKWANIAALSTMGRRPHRA